MPLKFLRIARLNKAVMAARAWLGIADAARHHNVQTGDAELRSLEEKIIAAGGSPIPDEQEEMAAERRAKQLAAASIWGASRAQDAADVPLAPSVMAQVERRAQQIAQSMGVPPPRPAAAAGIPPDARKVARKIFAAEEAAMNRAFSWDSESLCGLVDAIFGEGVSAHVTHEAVMVDCSEGSIGQRMMAAAHSVHETRVLQKEWDAQQVAAAAAANAPAALAEKEKRNFDRLRKQCLCAGLRIPGLSYAGLRADAVEIERNPGNLKAAQAACDEFCKIAAGDELAGLSDTVAARGAKRFIEAANGGKRFTIGMVPPKK
jgi:hypothetical protein